jgi:anaphase-promoting complex subunit 1
MASVRSLGLHEPSALPFLVAEDLLPPDPSENQYEWRTTVDEGPNGPVDDELVWTTSCVVWSRAGVVKKVFRLDIEREEIKHALFTRFSVEKSTESDGHMTQAQGLNGTSGSEPGQSRGPQSQPSQNSPGTSPSLHDRPAQGSQAVENGDSSRALVVVLKSQAHIFFLNGNSHVVPLPFEVDSVFATPRGLLFQRKMQEEDTSIYPMAPPNSFISSFPTTDFRASQSLELPSGKVKRPSLTISPAQNTALNSRATKNANLPRVFSLMDPHSEMGLVVTKQSSRWLQSSINSKPSGLDVLDPADEIVYVSPNNELLGSSRTLSKNPLILVVTVNMNTGLYTL